MAPDTLQSGFATTDFFGRQDAARKRTRLLVWLYATAVILICSTIGAGAWIAYAINTGGEGPLPAPVVAIIAAIITAFVIGAGSLYRIAQLRGGGSVVAGALGGKRISADTTDPDERRVLNVVEEMAIASGVPVPPVYLLDQETSINAFAAGYSPGDAVIGVTHGCIAGLTRDELQGVIAHEFSHILNGDMRLNIRMIGLINGIILLSLAGHLLFRSALYTPRSRSNKNDGSATMAILAIGLLLLIVGSIGSLMGRIIQAAVSRQREYLADAAAVQFTRNPEGIGNALRRLGGASGRGHLKSAHAEEANHMLFGEGIRSSFGSALASHPPLPKRIKAVLPGWDGTMLEPVVDIARQEVEKYGTPAQRIDQKIAEKRAAANKAQAALELLPLLAMAGNPTPMHVEHSRRIIQAIPQQLKDAARDPYGSRAVVYALLLDARDQIRRKQLDHLRTHGDAPVVHLVGELAKASVGLDRHLRLPLLDMTLGALAELSPQQHERFRANLTALVDADEHLDLFEWVTLKLIEHHLDERFHPENQPTTQYYSLNKLGPQLSMLLSVMAYAGQPNDDLAAAKAFELASRILKVDGLNLLAKDRCDLAPLEAALNTLRTVANRHKRDILQAVAVCAGSDRVITADEAELLRAIGDMLGVPTPPLLPGQRLA
ncbi:MAG: M48 family metallopeptidase [Phycisphaerales bacterium JB065]